MKEDLPAVLISRAVTPGATLRCGLCQQLLPAGRRQWCSNACRQAAYRRRHPPALPSPELPRAQRHRDRTVYECPECQARLVGEQRCPDCLRFCRSVGPGGPCPHCDEPVTIAELLALD